MSCYEPGKGSSVRLLPWKGKRKRLYQMNNGRIRHCGVPTKLQKLRGRYYLFCPVCKLRGWGGQDPREAEQHFKDKKEELNSFSWFYRWMGYSG